MSTFGPALAYGAVFAVAWLLAALLAALILGAVVAVRDRQVPR